MVIKIKPKFTKEYIQKALQNKLRWLKNAYLGRFEAIGEEFIALARTRADFTDQTGNLRSSIGYLILIDGKAYKYSFPIVKNGKEGSDTGLEVAIRAAEKFPSGIVLVCVAGMSYAAAVESKNRDVITGSIPIVKKLLVEAVENVQKSTRTR